MSPGIGLAGHLAAAQIYLNITPEQEPAWHDYCQAIIAMLDQPPPKPDQGPSLMAERMARETLSRAPQAQALLAAVTTLRASLDPAQLERLARMEPAPHADMPPPPNDGPHDGPNGKPS